MQISNIIAQNDSIQAANPVIEKATVPDGTYGVIVKSAFMDIGRHSKKPRLLLTLECDDKSKTNVQVAVNPASHQNEFAKFASLFMASGLDGEIEGTKASKKVRLPWANTSVEFAMGSLKDLIGCNFKARLETKKAGMDENGKSYGDKNGLQQEVARSTKTNPSFF